MDQVIGYPLWRCREYHRLIAAKADVDDIRAHRQSCTVCLSEMMWMTEANRRGGFNLDVTIGIPVEMPVSIPQTVKQEEAVNV